MNMKILFNFFYISCYMALFNEICINNCPSCSIDSYNNNFISENFDQINCYQKQNSSTNSTRKILIVPQYYQFNGPENVFDKVYISLSFALLNETYEMSKYYSKITLSFYFVNYEYEYYNNGKSSPIYFRYSSSNIFFSTSSLLRG